MFEIGVNLRVTESAEKGDRDHMEDVCEVHFEREAGRVVLGFFGVFDGHGGTEAALFAKKTLVHEMKKEALFWGEGEEEVLEGVRRGFIGTQNRMWNEREKWPRTMNGYKSTAGTTATVAIIRNKSLYIGHVGDSACVLGSSKVGSSRTDLWEATNLTVEHKPSKEDEKERIKECGGSICKKSGVERVVWRRRKQTINHKEMMEGDSIQYEEIPFLAVTRALGDLWSYDSDTGYYHISPEPDLKCITLNPMEHRCLILGTDGLWNVVSAKAAVEIVRICERETERRVFLDPTVNSSFFYNPAASLVKYALSQWKRRQIRADNVSAMVIMIDPPGPSMTKLREDRRIENFVSLNIHSKHSKKEFLEENLSKVLESELLIECSKWRSANNKKPDIKPVKVSETKEMSLDYNDSNLTTFNEPLKIIPLSNNTIASRIRIKTSSKSNVSELQQKCEKALISDAFYSKYCRSWINNNKIWKFLSYYFQINNLNSELEILNFLNNINPLLSSEIFKIIPWICCAKRRFKDINQLHVSLNIVPLFSEFWIELYTKFLNPLERKAGSEYCLNMKTTIGVLKPQIVNLLKKFNYLKSQHFADTEVRKLGLSVNSNKNNVVMLWSDKSNLKSDSEIRKDNAIIKKRINALLSKNFTRNLTSSKLQLLEVLVKKNGTQKDNSKSLIPVKNSMQRRDLFKTSTSFKRHNLNRKKQEISTDISLPNTTHSHVPMTMTMKMEIFQRIKPLTQTKSMIEPLTINNAKRLKRAMLARKKIQINCQK